jgi:hypothetical protein
LRSSWQIHGWSKLFDTLNIGYPLERSSDARLRLEEKNSKEQYLAVAGHLRLQSRCRCRRDYPSARRTCGSGLKPRSSRADSCCDVRRDSKSLPQLARRCLSVIAHSMSREFRRQIQSGPTGLVHRHDGLLGGSSSWFEGSVLTAATGQERTLGSGLVSDRNGLCSGQWWPALGKCHRRCKAQTVSGFFTVMLKLSLANEFNGIGAFWGRLTVCCRRKAR